MKEKSKKRRVLRVLIRALLFIAIIIVALVTFVLLNFPLKRMTKVLEQRLSRLLGQEVKIAQITVDFYPDVQLNVWNVRVTDPSTSREMGSVRNIRLDPVLLEIFKGRLVLGDIIIHEPELEITRKPNGEWNIEDIISSTRRNGYQEEGSESRVEAKEVKIRDGMLRFYDQRTSRVVVAEDLQGVIDLENDSVELDSVSISSPPFEATVSGALTEMSTPNRFLNFTSNIQVRKTGRLAEIESVDLPEGTIVADITANAFGLLRDLEVSTNFTVDPRLTGGLQTRGSLAASFNPYDGSMKVANLDTHFGRSEVSLSGFVEQIWTRERNVTLEGTGKILLEEVSGATESAFVSEVEPQGAVDASLKLTGSSEDVELKAELDFTPTTLTIPYFARKEPRTPGSLSFTALYKIPNEMVIENFELDVARARLTGTGRMTPTAEPSLQASMETNEIALRRLDMLPFANFEDGAVKLNAELWQASPASERIEYTAHGTIKDAFLYMENLTDPIEELNAQFRLNGQGVTVESSSFWFAGSKHQLQAEMKDYEKPRISGTLRSQMVDIDQLAATIKSTKKADGEPGAPPDFSLSLVVEADSLYAGGVRTEAASAVLEISGGLCRFEPLEIKVSDGTLKGAVELDISRRPLTWATDFEGRDVNLENLAKQLHMDERKITGTLSADGTLTGIAASKKEEVLRSINGKLNLTARNGVIRGAPLLEAIYLVIQAPVGSMVLPGIRETVLLNTLIDAARTGGKSLDPRTTMYTKIKGTIDLNAGVAHTEDLRLEGEGATLCFNGDINLSKGTLDLKITAIPLGSIGSLIGAVPVAGKTLQKAQEAALSLDFTARGPLENPEVKLAMTELLETGNEKAQPDGEQLEMEEQKHIPSQIEEK